MTWTLQALTGEFSGKEIQIDKDMLVGRHQDADLLLQSAEISRRHAAFLIKEQALWLQDLKSSNGTFVNDVRIETETQLNTGDTVQFASFKFAVKSVEKKIEAPIFVSGVELQRIVAVDKDQQPEPIKQPAEAVAVAEIKQDDQPKTPAQEMSEQGMPELKERDASVQLTRDGMPQGVAIPKPAPIPEGIDIHAAIKHEACEVEIPAVCVEQEREAQKNASVGLISIIVIVVLAIIAFVMFK